MKSHHFFIHYGQKQKTAVEPQALVTKGFCVWTRGLNFGVFAHKMEGEPQYFEYLLWLKWQKSVFYTSSHLLIWTNAGALWWNGDTSPVWSLNNISHAWLHFSTSFRSFEQLLILTLEHLRSSTLKNSGYLDVLTWTSWSQNPRCSHRLRPRL